jgi:hypothetical protein
MGSNRRENGQQQAGEWAATGGRTRLFHLAPFNSDWVWFHPMESESSPMLLGSIPGGTVPGPETNLHCASVHWLRLGPCHGVIRFRVRVSWTRMLGVARSLQRPGACRGSPASPASCAGGAAGARYRDGLGAAQGRAAPRPYRAERCGPGAALGRPWGRGAVTGRRLPARLLRLGACQLCAVCGRRPRGPKLGPRDGRLLVRLHLLLLLLLPIV